MDSGSEVEDDFEEIGEDIYVTAEQMEEAFSRGLAKQGKAYLDKLELMIINDSVLEEDVNGIIESISILKSFVGEGGKHANKITLQELDDFGISSASVRHRIGLLAFLMGNRSPTGSGRVRRESSLSGIQSQASRSDEYEDDFETVDDTDESPRTSQRKGRSISHGSREENCASTPLDLDTSYNLDGGDAASNPFTAILDKVDDSLEDAVAEVYSDDAEDNDYSDDLLEGSDPGQETLVESEVTLVKRRTPSAPLTRNPSAAAVGYSGSSQGGGGTGSENGMAGAGEEMRRAKSASAAGKKRRSRVAGWIRDRQWSLGDKIGSGSFGEVYQGMNHQGRLFAVKQLHIAGQRNVVDELANEIQLMRDYAHPNIVGYLGAAVDEKRGVVNIFQEWVPGGSLAHLLKRFGAFNEHVVANYTRQILSGLHFLHANGIIHRDIKGGNVLVDESGSVKLADFGASTKVNAFDRTQETTSFKGTPYFMAPEVLGQSKYGRKGDIWAVGCTMIQMLTAQPPWKDRNLTGLVQLHILMMDWKGPPVYPSHEVSPECNACIERCFSKDESDRPSANELLQCPFLLEQDNLEDSGRIVQSFERKRLSALSEEGEETEGADLLEDSGVTQMADLRAQIARLASSTETLHPSQALPTAADNTAEASPRHDDTMGHVQRQIERRKLVKAAVEKSRQRGHEVDSDVPSPVGPLRLDTDNGHTQQRPPSSRNTSVSSSGGTPPSSDGTTRSANPFARGAGTKKIGANVKRSPQNAPRVVDRLAAPAPTPASATSTKDPQGSIPRLGADIIRKSRNARLSQDVSSARDSESLTPGFEPASPHPGFVPAASNDEYTWACLACHKENTEPGYCIHCSVVRGSTGKKGLSANVVKRTVS